jgi:hypothetical protein
MSNPKPPVDLGLVIAIHAFAQQGMFGDNQPHTAALRVQLESLGGKSYFLSLTVETARSLILAISNWPPVQDYLLELAQPVAPIGLNIKQAGRGRQGSYRGKDCSARTRRRNSLATDIARKR